MSYAIAVLCLYLIIGVFVCSHTYDEENKPMPLLHFLFIVPFWPLLFFLGRD